MNEIAIRGGTILSSRGKQIGDILVEGHTIVSVGDVGRVPAGAVEVNAEGKWIVPGAIDTQVHFREPGLEHKEDLESGTRAALAGGVTTIFEMPNTNPATTTEVALQDKLNRAVGRAWCDYSFFIGASPENVGHLALLEKLPGTPGIKIFMGSSTGSLLIENDEILERVLRDGVRPCPVHAEDEPRNRSRKALLSDNPHPREHPFLRDAESARLATERLLRLCKITKRPVHVLHVSTADEIPLLRDAKAAGLPVMCEVTPQHLFFNSDDYERLGSRLQMNPPIRGKEHQAALWNAVRAGLFDVFGSDHAPHTLTEKALPYPNSPSGLPGVQTLLPLVMHWVINGELDQALATKMLSETPAKLYGVKRKGQIAPGFDADLVIFDPAATTVLRDQDMLSKCGWTPYDGQRLSGKIHEIYLRGQRTTTPQGKPVDFDWK